MAIFEVLPRYAVFPHCQGQQTECSSLQSSLSVIRLSQVCAFCSPKLETSTRVIEIWTKPLARRTLPRARMRVHWDLIEASARVYHSVPEMQYHPMPLTRRGDGFSMSVNA